MLRFWRFEVPKAGTILIATRDGVLADSLRFSLELEGFAARLCDELSLFPSLAATDEAPAASCSIRMCSTTWLKEKSDRLLAESSHARSAAGRGLDAAALEPRARRRHCQSIVEKPRLGGVLLEAVEDVIDGEARLSPSGEARSGWRFRRPRLRSSP